MVAYDHAWDQGGKSARRERDHLLREADRLEGELVAREWRKLAFVCQVGAARKFIVVDLLALPTTIRAHSDDAVPALEHVELTPRQPCSHLRVAEVGHH